MAAFDLSAGQRAVHRRYAELALPRHTSYPSSPVWTDRFGPDEYRAADVPSGGAVRLLLPQPRRRRRRLFRSLNGVTP